MAGTSPIFLLILILLIVLSMRSIHIFNLSKKMQNNDVLKPAKYFSELEKNVLLALVEKYKYVLECKKSDARTIALKQRTWQALAHEYNSQPSVSLRDFKQLKKCWENIKARTRKIMAHERREKVMRCGLGSSNIKEKVASMIPDQIYYVQTPSEEESTYNHEPSKTALELDCKKVNLLDLELLIDEQGKIQTKPFNKATETESLCDESSPSSSVEKESFVIPEKDIYAEKSIVNVAKCQGNMQSSTCSSANIPANRTYRNKLSQNGLLTKMHEEEHHQQMSILQLQLIQMNEVHVAKVQQIERECEMAEVEHRIKMEILNKKKMYWERKLQTITKEWPVASFNRPFPNSP
ncbi:myb/SANT-like DNA-binding domain-containing protein 3 isoform X3 [Pyxicephalus adspersus]|uniref:myb/SANT-like DNA-binding domain-containing protein 3 isoform X3 n=1 Tax=Pyxicephalus adspersus TaxID=30357 RepID=UPI003B5B2E2A